MTKMVVTSAAVSAAVACVFGFVGGYMGADQQVRESVLASLSPSFVKHAAPAAPKSPEAPPAPPAPVSDEQMVEDAVQTVSPAVVSIVISKDVPTYEEYQVDPFQGQNNDFFNQFFGNQMPGFTVPQYKQNGTQKQDVGAGSGFVVSADGYIVTNKHVVADEHAEYTVILSDKRKFTAKVLARDPVNDIAILKIDADGLPTVPFADSDKLRVGQRVIAIGYALGQFTNSVSTGIVSGLQRSIQAGDNMGGSEDLYDVIQTDAAINPGNSGGPLLDSKGRAIGMNVAMVQGSQSIGFALPINDVKKAYETVKGGGKIANGAFLGVRYVMITKELKAKNQLPVDQGALVSRGQNADELAVMPSSPADVAGIVENDIILEVNGKKLTEDYPLTVAVRKAAVGDKLTLKVLHKGQQKTVTVTLTEKK